MAKTFREWKPEQAVMFPPTVLDLVEKEDVVHFVRNLVMEQLDLAEITGKYDEERGYPPFHPVMMTALLLYGYTQGDLFVTANGAGMPTAGGFYGLDGNAETGLSDDQFVPAAASEGIGSTVWTSVAIVSKSGISQARTRGTGWDSNPGQREQE
jgi:hypothetical protein